MTPDEIQSHAPSVLSQAQRESYFRDGFVVVDGLVPAAWLTRLNAASDQLIEASREVRHSDSAFDLGPSHCAERPHVRRLKALVDRDPVFWAFAAGLPMVDIAADLVGPDVKFHSAKLNFKWPGDDGIVKWHQDIPAWPHTNYSPVTLGVYLEDVTLAQGPLACVPGSHDGPLFEHRDAAGNWTGAIAAAEVTAAGAGRATALCAAAGTLVAINCRTVHGSRANASSRVRPVALFVYSAADAFPWTATPTPTEKTGRIVRGNPARFAHLDSRPCPVPPDWARIGYGSIFTAQQGSD